MMFERFNHVLSIPGILIVFFAGLNLRRFFAWCPSIATVVDVQPAIGEFVGDRVKVEYVFDHGHHIADVGIGFCQTSRELKVNDKVEVLVNPLNTKECICYDLKANIFSLAIGFVMIIF